MAEYTVEGDQVGGHVADVVPMQAVLQARGELGSPAQVESEIDDMLAHVRDFWEMEPDQVMRMCAAYTARCTELYVKLHRIEGRERAYKQIRTQHVNPLLDELERQYTNASRMIAIRDQDIRMLRSMT